MTDVTYTAWDDNQYQWPPPDGWYEATDGKWWPEGYGPPAAESSTAVDEASVEPSPADDESIDVADDDASDDDIVYDDGDDPVDDGDEIAVDDAGDEFADEFNDEFNDEFTDELADDVTEDIADGVADDDDLGEWADGNGSTGLHDAESVDQLNDWNSSVDQTREIDPITEPVAANVAAAAAAPTESTLDRLDDLQPQISAQPVADSVATSSDLDIANFDPTETIDIEPNDINLDSDPYYGSPDATTTIDTAPPAQGSADYQGIDSPAPEQTASVETFESELAVDRGRAPILTPASMPPPKTGAGRRLLYVVLGLLALMAAGIAGYLLFQLQDDDTTEAGTANGDAQAVADNGQLGSLSQPHDLAKGIKINYPTDNGDQTWVLEVAEPATLLAASDGDQEVMAKLRLRNESESRSVALSELRFNLVSSDGSAVISANDGCSAGDDLDTNTALEPGGQAAGALCWTVPEAQAGGSLLGVESTQVLGRVHVSLS